MRPLVIAVDFDATLVEYEFPEIGAPLPGAFSWVRRWQSAGARVALWTVRSDAPAGKRPVLSEAVAFCRANGFEPWAVNENPGQAGWSGSPKMHADVFVDDAAFGCPLRPAARPGSRPVVDWDVVGPAVLARITAHQAGR